LRRAAWSLAEADGMPLTGHDQERIVELASPRRPSCPQEQSVEDVRELLGVRGEPAPTRSGV